MKARIKYNYFKGNYTNEWLEKNKDKTINGSKVGSWNLVEPYDFSNGFLMPKYVDGSWVEGASENEIEAMKKAKIPKSVKNMKLRLALIQSGVSISSIDAAIQAIEDTTVRESIQTMWEYAEYYERYNPQLIAMAASIGIIDEQLDQLFILADTL